MKSINMWRYFVLLLIALFLSYSSFSQDNYYWVGGSGNWSDFSNHWATSSGGAEFHASAPTEIDNVFFDENSFTETGQVVTLDVEEAEIHDMDWTGISNTVSFVSDETRDYTELTLTGSVHLHQSLTMGIDNLGFYPKNGDEEIINTEDIAFENARVYFSCYQGSLVINGNVSASSIGFVNMFYDIDFNSNEIRTTDEFELRLTLYATVDLTNVQVYTKDFRLTSALGSNGQILTSGASVNIVYPDGTTQIDKSRHPIALFENYTIAANHSIINEDANFDNLIIEPGVELIIHDYIEGIEVNNLIANGEADSRISIRSYTTNTAANIIKSTGEVNVNLVDFKDIAGTGGASFNAYGSRDEGNVSGWNFMKADQEIELELDAYDYEDINQVFALGGSASSGLDITYTSSNENVATISGSNEIQITGLGTANITATQTGDILFNAAEPVIRVLEVTKANQSISFDEVEDTWVGEDFVDLNVSSTSGLPVNLSVSGPAELNGTNLDFTGVGTVQVTATQVGDDNYFAAVEVSRTFEIFKAEQTITFDEIQDILLEVGSLELTAESSSGLDVSFSVSGPAELQGNSLILQGAGVVEIVASQQGDSDYLAASNITRSFEILAPLSASVQIAEVKVYPNPVVDKLFIDNGMNLKAQLYNSKGQVVRKSADASGEMDVADLAPGVYFLKISHDQALITKQIVKHN